MRKYNLITVAILTIVLLLSFVACNNEGAEKKLPSNVSYAEFEVYCGQSNSFFVEISAGKREQPLNADGLTKNVSDYFEIKLLPFKVSNFNLCYVVVTGESGKIEGEAKISMTDNEFILTSLNKVKIGNLKSVTIKFGDAEENIELTNMLLNNINWESALEIAKGEFKERLDADTSNSSREIFVKLTRDRRAVSGNYFWYVCYIGQTNDFWSLLIDAKDGTIIAKR